jgi:hypothetical protein
MRLSPLGTSVTVLPIVPAPILDESLEQLVGRELAGETEVLRWIFPHCHIVHHKSHMIWPGLEPSDWPPELWNDLSTYITPQLFPFCRKSFVRPEYWWYYQSLGSALCTATLHEHGKTVGSSITNSNVRGAPVTGALIQLTWMLRQTKWEHFIERNALFVFIVLPISFSACCHSILSMYCLFVSVFVFCHFLSACLSRLVLSPTPNATCLPSS